jgi:MFS transporter, Spinster family, sphingosine-1-phosphate transporter
LTIRNPQFKIESPGQILWVLTLINFLNYFDRQVIFPLFTFLKTDFGLSDFELGLLGTVFMIVHAIASVPLGILADKWIRKNIISFGVIVWSVATFFSGLVSNFHQLLAARSIVGIGEAAYGPSATSLLADKFPEDKRAHVNSIFHLGMFAGGTLGMILAGVLGTHLGWRICFFIVGVPGFILAVISWRIAEKKQEHTFHVDIERATIFSMFKIKEYVMVLLGGIFLTFTSGSIISWITVFIVRYHNFSVQDASLYLGSIVLVTGLAGIYFGGRYADKFYKKGMPRSFMLSIGFLIATPLLVVVALTSSKVLLLISLTLATFCMSWYYGPIVALIQDIVPFHLKASAYAFYIFFVHLLGDTMAPSIIGKLSDMSNLRTAFLFPIATNFIGAVFFVIVTVIMKKKILNRQLG